MSDKIKQFKGNLFSFLFFYFNKINSKNNKIILNSFWVINFTDDKTTNLRENFKAVVTIKVKGNYIKKWNINILCLRKKYSYNQKEVKQVGK